MTRRILDSCVGSATAKQGAHANEQQSHVEAELCCRERKIVEPTPGDAALQPAVRCTSPACIAASASHMVCLSPLSPSTSHAAACRYHFYHLRACCCREICPYCYCHERRLSKRNIPQQRDGTNGAQHNIRHGLINEKAYMRAVPNVANHADGRCSLHRAGMAALGSCMLPTQHPTNRAAQPGKLLPTALCP